MRYLVLAGAIGLALSASQAEARQCYRRVVEPSRYSLVAEEVLVSPAREIAEYVPEVTREVEEVVVVRPEQTISHVIPAEYGVEAQTVEVAPPHREWRTRDENGDIIGCWVNVPARYAQIAHRVQVSPAHTVEQTIPAQTATRLRTVVVEPGHTIAHTIPARYATHEREVLVAPAHSGWAPIEGCEPAY